MYFSMLITPKFGDIDGLGHVNNTVMPGWFEQARNMIYRCFNPELNFSDWNLILARFEVDFVKQLYFNQEVEIRTYISHIGNSSLEVYQEAWQNDQRCTKGKTVLVHFDFKKQKSIPISPDIRAKLETYLHHSDQVMV
ncbi:acyl-CoA thioesterase [Microbacter margulisiae]|uniref:Acyl-CoA thioester hydrolase n=1 Tax=Microbacter margulisiae TaxID=1350067 RepID=A0A7W5DPI8_9PORP|nr:thioesterase family protein [Microbacter margulisiae]MBB3186189.1 acyl-CoA thioester hydrolase [Microbacter margulisiae]